jgi:hypothetical protein
MKNLKAYVDQKNRWDMIFGKPAVGNWSTQSADRRLN